MKRSLFSIIALVSLLLCIATAVTWSDSTGSLDRLFWAEWTVGPVSNPSRILGLAGESGEVSVSYERIDRASGRIGQLLMQVCPPGFHLNRISLVLPGSSQTIHAIQRGIGFTKKTPSSPSFQETYWELRCPAWAAVAIFALTPILHLASALRRRRSAGLCSVCGYDLRATPGRCPECGTPITKAEL